MQSKQDVGILPVCARYVIVLHRIYDQEVIVWLRNIRRDWTLIWYGMI